MASARQSPASLGMCLGNPGRCCRSIAILHRSQSSGCPAPASRTGAREGIMPAAVGPAAAACGACPGAVAGASAAAGAGASVLGVSAAALFGASSAIMVPVYGMMAFLPTAKLTRFMLLSSPALYVGLALLYAVTLVAAWQAGLGAALAGVAAAVPSYLAGGGGASAVDLGPLAHMFSQPLVTLVAWLHLLTLDALMAREVALDGIRTGVSTSHSVLLCFFFGPTGLLSHAITRMLQGRSRS